MKIRSAVPENGCLIVLVDGKKQKTNKKTIAKHRHICIRLLPEGGCENDPTNVCISLDFIAGYVKHQRMVYCL